MRTFHIIPGTESSLISDFKHPDRYYALPTGEWEKILKEHLKYGHPDSGDGRYFSALPDDFTVRVRPYLPNASKTEYFEQETWIEFPANRIVPEGSKGM